MEHHVFGEIHKEDNLNVSLNVCPKFDLSQISIRAI